MCGQKKKQQKKNTAFFFAAVNKKKSDFKRIGENALRLTSIAAVPFPFHCFYSGRFLFC